MGGVMRVWGCGGYGASESVWGTASGAGDDVRGAGCVRGAGHDVRGVACVVVLSAAPAVPAVLEERLAAVPAGGWAEMEVWFSWCGAALLGQANFLSKGTWKVMACLYLRISCVGMGLRGDCTQCVVVAAAAVAASSQRVYMQEHTIPCSDKCNKCSTSQKARRPVDCLLLTPDHVPTSLTKSRAFG